MVTIHAIPGHNIVLGREGENLARQVVFDISEWRASYGDGTVSLIAQRHGDAEPYPCNITVDGDTVTWPITSADTAHPDYGHCEMRYSVGDVLVKSETWRTFVADALGTPQPEPPEPQKAWVDKVLEAGQAAVDASVNAPKIGSNGNWWVWDADAGAYVDTGVKASGGGSGAVSSVNGKTGDVELKAGDVDAIPAPATASVGQIVQVKAVDDAGKPTEWEAADMAAGGVTDVKINDKSIVGVDGVATIPKLNMSPLDDLSYGLPALSNGNTPVGIGIHLKGSLMTLPAKRDDITNRKERNYFDIGSTGSDFHFPICPGYLDYSVKAAMCDGKGAAWTDAERIAALLRMGCTVDDNGFVKWTEQEVSK